MVLNFQCMIIMFFFCLVTSLFSETAINQDAEMCNAAMDQGNPQVINNNNNFCCNLYGVKCNVEEQVFAVLGLVLAFVSI